MYNNILSNQDTHVHVQASTHICTLKVYQTETSVKSILVYIAHIQVSKSIFQST